MTPTPEDVELVGRPYPDHGPVATLTPLSARATMQDRREWWLDAAEGYLGLAAHARRLFCGVLASQWLFEADRCRRESQAWKVAA